ncbi:MAG: magnesium/cobalt transporter CorA [Kiritimatiellae bacterium]|nr:magnesium/cobalt transporter CorA [Kiritimatiellia bacterium]
MDTDADIEEREPVRLEIARYYDKECLRRQNLTLDEALSLCDGVPGGGITWFNVEGVHDAAVVEAVGQRFNMHPLVIEDVMHTTQRPKVEDYGDHIFVVARTLSYDEIGNEVGVEQVSFVLGANWLVLFQERPGDAFASVRQRMDTAGTRIRQRGADYLLYAFLDAIVDSYFGVLENIGERIEEAEDQLVEQPENEQLKDIHALRKQLLALRRSIWPMRDAVSILQHSVSKLIAKGTDLYLRDVYDHITRLIDTVETHRETVTSLYDMYMSTVTNRLNAIMKVLTIISTIFIPITFVSGVFGMNFEFMPELHHPWGYPAALGLMLAIVAAMLYFFRRQRWI